MEYLACNENNLSELDLSGLSDLKYLQCFKNNLSELDLTGLDKLDLDDVRIDGQTIELSLTGNSVDGYKANIPLNSPEFDDPTSAITYKDGNLASTDPTVESVGFTVKPNADPIHGELLLSGTIYLSYPEDEDPIYYADDIEVINNIIDDNGLDWEKAPEDGSSVPSDWEYYVEWSEGPSNRRITQLSLWQLGLSGTLDVSGLSSLQELDCSENNLSEL